MNEFSITLCRSAPEVKLSSTCHNETEANKTQTRKFGGYTLKQRAGGSTNEKIKYANIQNLAQQWDVLLARC